MGTFTFSQLLTACKLDPFLVIYSSSSSLSMSMSISLITSISMFVQLRPSQTVATGRRTEKAMPQTCASKCAAPCFTLASEHLKQFALCRRQVCCVWQQLSPNFFPAPLWWLKARHISFPLLNLEEYSQAMISSSSWCRGQILCLYCYRTLFHLT